MDGLPLRWGVLGTAQINEKILPHFNASKQNCLTAIASRDFSKAKSEAVRWKIGKPYGSYAELISNPDLDAVYISLPNHLHFEWARASLLGGKHVLCEKPLTLTASDALELRRIATERKLFLAEGYMYRHHAQSIRILELVRTGALGEIRHVHASFHITVAPGPNIRTNALLGGGAVYDVGCYLINFANAIMGRAPVSLSAHGRIHGISNEEKYDSLFSTLLNYGDGITAHLDGGFLGPRLDEMRILGSEGWLEIPHPFKPTPYESLQLFRRPTRESKVETETIDIKDERDPFASEIEAFSSTIRNGIPFPIGDWESVAGVSTAEKVIEQIRN